MATGTKGFKGLAVPLNGESQIKQVTAADDIITITGASGQAGDFIVAENSSGTEKFVVDKNGYITASRVNLGVSVTTPPTTGLTKGEIFVVWSTSSPVLALCTSTAGKTIKYISPFDTKTLGRTT